MILSNRRNFLSGIVSGGAALLSGCLGGGGDRSSDEDWDEYYERVQLIYDDHSEEWEALKGVHTVQIRDTGTPFPNAEEDWQETMQIEVDYTTAFNGEDIHDTIPDQIDDIDIVLHRVGGILKGTIEIPDGEYTVLQAGTRISWDGREGDEVHAMLFSGANEIFAHLDLDAVADEERSNIEQFVDETDFTTSRIVFASTVGNYHEYRQALVDDLAVDSGSIAATIVAYSEEILGDASYNYPAVLIRVIFENNPAETAHVTLVQGGDRERVGGGPRQELELTAD